MTYFASLEKQFVEEIRKRMNVVKEIQRINQEELEKGYDDRTSWFYGDVWCNLSGKPTVTPTFIWKYTSGEIWSSRANLSPSSDAKGITRDTPCLFVLVLSSWVLLLRHVNCCPARIDSWLSLPSGLVSGTPTISNNKIHDTNRMQSLIFIWNVSTEWEFFTFSKKWFYNVETVLQVRSKATR